MDFLLNVIAAVLLTFFLILVFDPEAFDETVTDFLKPFEVSN